MASLAIMYVVSSDTFVDTITHNYIIPLHMVRKNIHSSYYNPLTVGCLSHPKGADSYTALCNRVKEARKRCM